MPIFPSDSLYQLIKDSVPELIAALKNDSDSSVRLSAAQALGKMVADAKLVVPDLVKALQNDSDSSVRHNASQALVSIALNLQEQATTLSPAELDQLISDLSPALKSIQSANPRLSNADISALRLSLNALQAQKNAHFSNWIRQNKWLAGGLFYLVFFPSLWSMLFWLRPRWLVAINDALKPYEFKLPDSLGGAPVKIRDLTFFSLFSDRPRVLDAWVNAHISTVREEFKTLETVQERRTYISIPVILDGNTLPDLTSESLRPLFDRQRACLLIVGEGGSGKTSIACQIALWAIQETPEHRLAPHLTIPILIEEELTPQLTATPHPLRETIRRQLQDLTREGEPISDELLANLLKHRRILVILDHISEMSEATRQQIQQESLDINALVITSRLKEPLNRTTQCPIEPLRIAGNRLSSFMEAYLNQRGKRGLFTDKEFFNACIQLSDMVGTRDITVLLAKLYAEQLISAKEGYQSADLPENIPDLMLSYLNELNRDVTEDKLADRTLHQDAKAIAWECLKERYRPASAHIKDAIAALPAPDADQRLHYLESKLRLLQTVGVGKENLRFALDPVAEYLAGLYLVDLYKTDSQKWQDFFKTADAQSGAPDAIKGFLLAVRDCYLAKIPGAKDSDFVPKAIGDRTMTPSAPPQAVAQPVSP
jgi:HEAT repeat protein